MSEQITAEQTASAICRMFSEAYSDHKPFPGEPEVLLAINRHTQQMRDQLARKSAPAKKETYAVKEAAVYLRRSTKTIYKWISEGVLRASTVSRKKEIPAEDVEKLYATTC